MLFHDTLDNLFQTNITPQPLATNGTDASDDVSHVSDQLSSEEEEEEEDDDDQNDYEYYTRL
jgi:hypothetical protein